MNRTLKFLSVPMIWLVQTSSASACPMCKYALESDAPEPRAYMVSILFMLAMMTVMFVGVGMLLWWVARHEKMALDAAGYQHVFDNAGSQPYQTRLPRRNR